MSKYLLAIALAAYPAFGLTTISQTITNNTGAVASGRAYIKISEACRASSTFVSTTTRVVTFGEGLFLVSLVPNDSCIPAGTTYSVVWQLDTGETWTETWRVPITSATLHVTDVLVDDTGTGGTSHYTVGVGGIAGQIQINSGSGGLAGITIGGDAVLNSSNGAVTVTKTGGVTFAPSATTDTTVASNITSGVLDPARLPFTLSGTGTRVPTIQTSPTPGCATINSSGGLDSTGTPCGSGSGSATYTASISGTSTTILATTHNLGTAVFVAGCRDTSGHAILPDWVIASGNVTITTLVATSGSCTINSAAPSAGVYAAAFSGASTTIAASTHQRGTGVMVASCITSTGRAILPDTAIDGSGTVTISFASGVTASGTCYLR